jgi:hypothetical protein
MGLFRQNGLRAFRPLLDSGNEVDDPMADFLDRSSIGLIEDRKKEDEDDRMSEKGIEHRASVSPPPRPRGLKKFRGRINGKRKRDLSYGEGGDTFFWIRSLKRGW